MDANGYDLSTWDGVMVGESEVQGYLWLQSELEVSLGFKRPYLIKRERAGEMVQRDTIVCICNPGTPVVRWENHQEPGTSQPLHGKAENNKRDPASEQGKK